MKRDSRLADPGQPEGHRPRSPAVGEDEGRNGRRTLRKSDRTRAAAAGQASRRLPGKVCGVTRRAGEDCFAAFDIAVKRRGRSRWKWSVYTTDGHTLMCGSECSRAGARYKAERALFLLLCASASRLGQLPPEELVRRSSRRSKSVRASRP